MSSNRILALAAAIVFGIAGTWSVAANLLGQTTDDGAVVLPGQLGSSLFLALVHLAFAVALALAGLHTDQLSRYANTATGALLLALGLFGLFAIGSPANVFGLTGASNVLHFAASATLLAAGLGAAPAGPARKSYRQGDG